ncbi:triosephosphate isomerase [Phakopsora pachyrhizi]|uniref:Triosephosphate isomerase n=1 Tax=Phakopsora pachyrhizi TaxID=170000 RepID=A0AAV0BBY2_PHAPC|nr:triosephosphate isomerase [Phakopsora pachyrhizi]CAH7684858.1 triosephosphate isomerase [Phakopsora pachyrhizi]
MPHRKFFVAGNFKMNGTQDSLLQIVKNLSESDLDPDTEIVIAPPSLYLLPIRDAVKSNILVSAQNGYFEKSGAFTGEISFPHLVDAKIPYVILGHPERRSVFHEDSDFIGEKTGAALESNLSVIACIGEDLTERGSNKTFQVIESQLDCIKKGIEKHHQNWDKVVIAYDPIWVIGTSQVVTPKRAQEVHKSIREWLKKNVNEETAEKIRIIYAGGVNAGNCLELSCGMDVDGFLVGGASLRPEFVEIVNSGKAKY